MRAFTLLWLTQSLSSLGSAMTNFALVIWSYELRGSALATALLAISSYAPYVLLSVFAGALADRFDKKRAMLICDGVAALGSLCVLILYGTGNLQLWCLYVINALNGLMNTVQQPAADVAQSLLVPKEHYQKASGMRSFSNALVGMLSPVFASSLFSLAGLGAVICFDLLTFLIAALSLLLFINIPREGKRASVPNEPILRSFHAGLGYLRENRGILDLILLLALINLTASMYNAALPAMLLSRHGGGKMALGWVNTVTALATMAGSLLVTALPSPKSRAKVILNSLLFSMGTENFILAFGRSVPVWCVAAALGWVFIPLMGANLDVLLRSRIPVPMQGRVFAARNSLQFFTIPLGYFCGGFLVDRVFEPFMAKQPSDSLLAFCFGQGKGSGAAFFFLVIGLLGLLSCLPFRFDKHIKRLEE
jgi:MFS family permease